MLHLTKKHVGADRRCLSAFRLWGPWSVTVNSNHKRHQVEHMTCYPETRATLSECRSVSYRGQTLGDFLATFREISHHPYSAVLHETGLDYFVWPFEEYPLILLCLLRVHGNTIRYFVTCLVMHSALYNILNIWKFSGAFL